MELRHDLVRAMVRHFLGVFEYQGVPIRVSTKPANYIRSDQARPPRKRYLKVGPGSQDVHDLQVERGWTLHYPESKAIYVNTAAHKTYEDLVDTCAHEALHAARWQYHVKAFQPTIDAAVAVFLGR